ncbi:hypothetical protein A3194_14155 [Candidatus Thiodiazotropha endoloripes]|uniref:hypothetical protein n=1 Tax=Candidatus Thiodiazotropha endoloripes TaxID=1818881 RepID=UPI00083DB441|nr:hypothetical protein [Candidatus Thiodiazotropha endoloripes]ODB84905.1 hypothetical protein A3194_14155 [Candidatus Thiodiazotropha endoloripes]
MRFQVEGPFELDRNEKGLIDSTASTRRAYWDWVEEFSPELPDACGCYIFSIRASRGSLPWYIGKAERQTFRKECLSAHKIVHFNNVVVGRKGKPELFFLPQITGAGRYRSPTTTQRRAIQELESLLIGMAIQRNPKLSNIAGTKWLQNLTVDGFLNSLKTRSGAAKELRTLFGE